MTGFRWNDWNREHATKHHCTIEEIESVVRREGRNARYHGDGKWRVEGRGIGGRFIEVIFVYEDPQASVVDDETAYVIHAQPLTIRRRKN